MTGIKKNTQFLQIFPTHSPLLLTVPTLLCASHQPSCRRMAINRCVLVLLHSVCEPWLFCLVSVCVYTSANIHITLYMLDGDFLWSRADECVCVYVCVFYTSRKVLDIAYCLISVSLCVERASMGRGSKAVSPVCKRTQGSFG